MSKRDMELKHVYEIMEQANQDVPFEDDKANALIIKVAKIIDSKLSIADLTIDDLKLALPTLVLHWPIKEVIW